MVDTRRQLEFELDFRFKFVRVIPLYFVSVRCSSREIEREGRSECLVAPNIWLRSIKMICRRGIHCVRAARYVMSRSSCSAYDARDTLAASNLNVFYRIRESVMCDKSCSQTIKNRSATRICF